MTRRLFVQGLGAALVSPLLARAQAQGSAGFPSKPVRFVVPYAPGTSVDVVTRIVAKKLNERLGWTTLIENKPGGRLTIAMQTVLDAPADGHTLLASASAMPVMPTSMKNMPFDLLRDFEWITRTANLQLMLAANNDVPFKNAAQMVAFAKANPGKLRFASFQPGSGTHLVGEAFADQNGIRITHVPYKDTSFAADVAGGSVELAIFSVTTLAPIVQSGRVRGLAILGKRRSPLFPEISTVGEQGLPEVDVDIWSGVTGKAGTPKPVIDRLSAEINAVLQLQDVRDFIQTQGGVAAGEPPAAFRAKVASEIDMWAKLIRDRKIPVE